LPRFNVLAGGAGMGLGLSFVQLILQHHGATLQIESASLKGAVLRVLFPAGASGGAAG
jgi:signal transduction histidine kinase